MSKALLPGSYDPITVGHLDIIRRCSKLFDEIIVLISKNSAKNYMLCSKDRAILAEDAVKDIANVKVEIYDGFLVDYAKANNIDVTVKGKKYQISPAALSAEDIVITAQTNNVDSAGNRTLQLKPEIPDGADYTITTISQKNIDVYFDTSKTVQMVIEPQVIADDFPIVDEGFTCGNINLSETSVTVTGPSTEINRIDKVVAQLELKKSLSSNKSADAEIVLLSDKNRSDFKYVTMSIDKVILTIPVLQVKELETIVTFKNAPDNYVVTPLKYSVSPSKDLFNISVDDYDKTIDYSIGTIDFKTLSPSNHVFTFLAEDVHELCKEDTACSRDYERYKTEKEYFQ